MVRRNRPGTEPRSARSPLRLRAVVAGAALVLSLAVLLATTPAALDPDSDERTRMAVASVILAAVTVTAAVDLVVVLRRIRRGDRG